MNQRLRWSPPDVVYTPIDVTSENLAGGAFGYGLSRNIRQGYKFLVDHHEVGDEIYIFGFSRGAYTARSLAGLIRNIGLLNKEHATEDRPDDNPVLVEGYEIYRERDDTPDADQVPGGLGYRRRVGRSA